MNLRKRRIFEVEQVHEKMKNTRCVEKDTNARKKLKTADGVGVLIHRIHASNDSVYEAAEELIVSRRKYHEIKTKLRSVIAEKEQIREDLCNRKNYLQKVTSELRQAVADLKTLDTNKLSEQEGAMVMLNSWIVEEDVIEAWKHISFADNDLNDEDTYDKTNTKKDVRTLNSVSLPNVISNGIVSLNGSININRNKCCVCLDRRINAVLYKCGHVCMCFNCASELMRMSQDKKCPVCRTDIIDVIKTYLV